MECVSRTRTALAFAAALATLTSALGRPSSAQENAARTARDGQVQDSSNRSNKASSARNSDPNSPRPNQGSPEGQPANASAHANAPTSWRFADGMIFGWVDQSSRNSGMTLAPADAALRAQLKLPDDQGLIVTALEPGSAAAAVGIRQNDVLLLVGNDHVGKFPVAKVEDLSNALKSLGELTIKVDLLRDGQRLTIRAQPRIHPTLGPVRPEPLAYWIGVTVASVEPALRAQLRLPENQGLIVMDVDKNGPAARAGVRRFDILKSFDGENLVDQAGLTRLVQSRAGKLVPIDLLREGKPQEIMITPERRQTATLTVGDLQEAQAGNWDLVFNSQVVTSPVRVFTNETLVPLNGVTYSPNGLNTVVGALPPDGSWIANVVGDHPVDAVGAGNPASAKSRSDGDAAVARKLDELSAQIKELRQALEALAKSQAKK